MANIPVSGFQEFVHGVDSFDTKAKKIPMVGEGIASVFSIMAWAQQQSGRVFNVLDYGAVADARYFNWADGFWYKVNDFGTTANRATDNAAAFAACSAALDAAGGGVFLVPGFGDPVEDPGQGAGYALDPLTQPDSQEGPYSATTKGFHIKTNSSVLLGTGTCWLFSQGPDEGGLFSAAPGNGGYSNGPAVNGEPESDTRKWMNNFHMYNIGFDQRSVPLVERVDHLDPNSPAQNAFSTGEAQLKSRTTLQTARGAPINATTNDYSNYYESTILFRHVEEWSINACNFRLPLSADGVIVFGNGTRRGVIQDCVFYGRNYGMMLEFDGGRDVLAVNNRGYDCGGLTSISNLDNGILNRNIEYRNNTVRGVPQGWGLYKDAAWQSNKSSLALGLSGGEGCVIADNKVYAPGYTNVAISIVYYTTSATTQPTVGSAEVTKLHITGNKIYEHDGICMQLTHVISALVENNAFFDGTTFCRVQGNHATADQIHFKNNYCDADKFFLQGTPTPTAKVKLGMGNDFGPNASSSNPWGTLANLTAILPNGARIDFAGELRGDLTDTTA